MKKLTLTADTVEQLVLSAKTGARRFTTTFEDGVVVVDFNDDGSVEVTLNERKIDKGGKTEAGQFVVNVAGKAPDAVFNPGHVSAFDIGKLLKQQTERHAKILATGEEEEPSLAQLQEKRQYLQEQIEVLRLQRELRELRRQEG